MRLRLVTGLLFKLEEPETPAYNLHLQQAERGFGYSLPRLVCEDVTTKLSLNGDLVTRGETRGIYIIAILVVVYGCSVKATGKGSPGVKEGKVMSDSATLRAHPP
jgi:hypothetical protein